MSRNIHIIYIRIYKLSDVGFSSNLTGSLSPDNKQGPPPGKVDNLRSETMVGVNSRFAVVTEEEIFQMLTFHERVVLLPS